MRLERFDMRSELFPGDSQIARSEMGQNSYEYQIRWVDSPLYYKREIGTELWSFCTDKEFAENVNTDNLIEWNPDEYSNRIPGGIADQMVPSQFEESDLVDGIRIEMEHTNDLYIAREIAMDHLAEDPDYYKKLKRIHR